MYYTQKKMNRKWTIVLTVLSATILFVSCSGENGKTMNKTVANPAVAYRAVSYTHLTLPTKSLV